MLIRFGSEVWPKTGLRNKSYRLAARKPKLYCSLTNGIQIWVLCQRMVQNLNFPRKQGCWVVILVSKLTRKPHINRIARKATTTLMQRRHIVDKTIYNEMDIHSYDKSNHVVCMGVLGWRSQQKVSSRKLTKVQRLACLMISSAFPGTPTGALEILHNITPIKKLLLAEAVRGSYRITVSGLWHVNGVGSFGKTKSHVDACNEARRFYLWCKCQLTE